MQKVTNGWHCSNTVLGIFLLRFAREEVVFSHSATLGLGFHQGQCKYNRCLTTTILTRTCMNVYVVVVLETQGKSNSSVQTPQRIDAPLKAKFYPTNHPISISWLFFVRYLPRESTNLFRNSRWLCMMVQRITFMKYIFDMKPNIACLLHTSLLPLSSSNETAKNPCKRHALDSGLASP